MSSITQSTSNTLVSMLGAVTTSANTVTRSVHTIASGLDMLDQYVQDARREQLARSMLNEKSMLQRIREDAAKDTAQRRDELERMLSASPKLAAHFEKAYGEFEDTMKSIEERLANMSSKTALIA